MNGGYAYREHLGAEAAGRTVLDWLSQRHRHSSEATWRARIAAGEVSLDGTIAGRFDRLLPGQSLVWHRPPWQEPDVPLGFAVLFRDAHLLAVAKPRGLPSLPNGGFLEHTLLHRVRRQYPEAVPMHRLGRGTSGIVLFARTPDARCHIAAEWRSGAVTKEYRALVCGHLDRDDLSIETPIGLVPHPTLGRVHAAHPDGRPSLSHVQVLERRDGATLVSVSIRTGRPHQIRIHMAAAGHPLLGDPLYVTGGIPGASPALPGAGGYWLHAHRLELTHPATGGRLQLECIPPAILRSNTEPSSDSASSIGAIDERDDVSLRDDVSHD